jgi:septum formation protein
MSLSPHSPSPQGLSFNVRASTFAENLEKSEFPTAAAYATATALQKALEVATLLPVAHLVISADTVVDLDGEVLEKPADAKDAVRMLSRLSGTRHSVHTGVALVFPRARDPVTHACPRVVTFSETTRVAFSRVPPAAIAAYVATGDAFGKAGAYGVQGAAGSFVTGIEGCYHNVVGLPLHRLSAELLALIEDGVLEEEATM